MPLFVLWWPRGLQDSVNSLFLLSSRLTAQIMYLTANTSSLETVLLSAFLALAHKNIPPHRAKINDSLKSNFLSLVCSPSINTDQRWERDLDFSYLRLTEVITALVTILRYGARTYSHTHSLSLCVCVSEENRGIIFEELCHCTILLLVRS